MAVCTWCKQEMMAATTATCSGNDVVEFPDGTILPSVSSTDNDGVERCFDCLILVGGKHHPGCDNERCPRCNGQLISCGCLNEEEDDNF